MGYGCLSHQMPAAETQEDANQPIYFVSAFSGGSRAHFAEDTTINTASKFPITRHDLSGLSQAHSDSICVIDSWKAQTEHRQCADRNPTPSHRRVRCCWLAANNI